MESLRLIPCLLGSIPTNAESLKIRFTENADAMLEKHTLNFHQILLDSLFVVVGEPAGKTETKLDVDAARSAPPCFPIFDRAIGNVE